MSHMKDIERYKLRKLIRELKRKKGRGTELISLYIPPGRRISDVIGYLRQEYSTAANIKSDLTRKHVQEAIIKVIERLKYYNVAPENGLVIFCGAIPESGPGTERMEIYTIVPPEPINVNLYRCDDHFHTEYLEDVLKEKDVYGLISIDVNNAAIGVLEGNRLEVLGEYTSGIPGKHRAGGQSARRFERLREMEIHNYFDRIALHVNEYFLSDDIYPRLKGILIGGPGYTKYDFVKEAKLDYRLTDKIIGYVDTNYSGEEGLREMIDKAKDKLKKARYVYEKAHVDEFLRRLAHEHNKVLYGLNEVFRHIYNGIIDKLLILEDFNKYYVRFKCERCGYTTEKFIDEKDLMKVGQGIKCEKCNTGIMYPEEEELVIDYLYDVSTLANFEVVLISPKTEYGKIFKQFSGIAALLKYPITY